MWQPLHPGQARCRTIHDGILTCSALVDIRDFEVQVGLGESLITERLQGAGPRRQLSSSPCVVDFGEPRKLSRSQWTPESDADSPLLPSLQSGSDLIGGQVWVVRFHRRQRQGRQSMGVRLVHNGGCRLRRTGCPCPSADAVF